MKEPRCYRVKGKKCPCFSVSIGVLCVLEKVEKEIYHCGAGQFILTNDKSNLPKVCKYSTSKEFRKLFMRTIR